MPNNVAKEKPQDPNIRSLKKERREIPFYPNHLFKEAIVALLVLAILMLMAAFFKVPTEPVANPTDTSYIPRPEWYFLFLFQALKYFHGPAEVLGTFLLPVLFVAVLIFLPFYDRRAEKRWTKRPVAISIASLILIAIIVLTVLADPISSVTLFADPAHGKQIFEAKGCAENCHSMTGKDDGKYPDLLHEGSKREPDYIYNHFKDPRAFVKDSEMPSPALPDKDLKDLTAYIMSLK